MKSYYYEENNTQKGPVSLEELKEKINRKTRVWTKGLPNWIEAQNLEELKTIFNLSTPPPLNSSKKEKSFALKRNVIFFIVFVVLVLGFFIGITPKITLLQIIIYKLKEKNIL